MQGAVVIGVGLLLALAIVANRRAQLAGLVDGGEPGPVAVDVVDPDQADPAAPTEEAGQGGALLSAVDTLSALDLSGWFSAPSESDLTYTNRDAFLRMIRMAEGTAGADGYRTMFGGQLFSDWSDHPRRAVQFTDKAGRRLWTSAAGAYQFMAVSPIPGGSTKVDTWDRLQRKLGLPDFSPFSQDLAAIELVRECGALDDVDAGRIPDAVAKCRRIWASLPGAGYDQAERSMTQLLAAYQAAGGALA